MKMVQLPNILDSNTEDIYNILSENEYIDSDTENRSLDKINDYVAELERLHDISRIYTASIVGSSSSTIGVSAKNVVLDAEQTIEGKSISLNFNDTYNSNFVCISNLSSVYSGLFWKKGSFLTLNVTHLVDNNIVLGLIATKEVAADNLIIKGKRNYTRNIKTSTPIQTEIPAKTLVLPAVSMRSEFFISGEVIDSSTHSIDTGEFFVSENLLSSNGHVSGKTMEIDYSEIEDEPTIEKMSMFNIPKTNPIISNYAVLPRKELTNLIDYKSCYEMVESSHMLKSGETVLNPVKTGTKTNREISIASECLADGRSLDYSINGSSFLSKIELAKLLVKVEEIIVNTEIC